MIFQIFQTRLIAQIEYVSKGLSASNRIVLWCRRREAAAPSRQKGRGGAIVEHGEMPTLT